VAVRPTPRAIVVCEDIGPDPTNPRRLTLHRVVHSIRPKVECRYPVDQPRLCAFVQLTECRGGGVMRLAVRRADTDDLLYRSPEVRVTFPGNDPLVVHGLRFTVRDVAFPAAGLDWIELWYDDDILTRTPVVLRPEPPTPE
jgi:hypothetical protein